MHETFPRIVQVEFSLLVDLTGTILGNVLCMTTQNKAVEFFRMAYLLQWVMIYSFGINFNSM